MKGDVLTLNVGYSHPVALKIPQGLTIKVDKQTNVSVTGIDKQLVGQFAAQVRQVKIPEPYKAKGIKYAEEQIRRKVGKTGAK